MVSGWCLLVAELLSVEEYNTTVFSPENILSAYFFGVQIFFPLRSAAEIFFRDKLMRHYFFSTKAIFFKAQSANRIFFSAHFIDRIFFQSNLPTEIFSPKKTIAPSLQFNGCSLTYLSKTNPKFNYWILKYQYQYSLWRYVDFKVRKFKISKWPLFSFLK